jgi:glucose/arabinose dehydrogenase
MRRVALVVFAVGVLALATAFVVQRSSGTDHGHGDAEVLATGLQVPWGLTFLPNGDGLVGERNTGRLYEVSKDGGDRTLVATVPGVVPGGEGGLLGLTIDPLFIHSGHSFVYAYLTSADDNRIVRFMLDPTRPEVTNLEVLVTGIAKAAHHDGGALAFGPDGMLYAGTGDAGVPERAQDPASLNGKILRMDPTGKPPVVDANPDPGSLVFSSGHRNVQGLAWDERGRLWATEFGQDTWDEVNLVRAGDNDGWPAVEGVGHDPAYVDPLVTWRPDQASPSGIAIAGGHLYVAALRGERLWAIPVAGTTVGRPESLLAGQYGRQRNVQLAPDSSLWVTTSNRDGRGDADGGDDRVLRLTIGSAADGSS